MAWKQEISRVLTTAIPWLFIVQCLSAQATGPLREGGDTGHVILEEVASLSFRGLPMAPNLLTQVFVLPDGGWGALNDIFGGEIPIFSPAGAPAGSLGQRGSGPGEFRNPVFASAPNGSLWVVDPGNNRITVFGRNLDRLAERTVPGRVFWAQPSPNGEGVLLSGFFGNGRTVCKAKRDGNHDEFGGNVGASLNPYVQMHLAAETHSGEIWAFATSGGKIDILRARDLEKMESTSLPGAEMQVEAPAVMAFDANARPTPLVRGVMVDPGNVLWIVLAVADENWRPGIDPREDATGYIDTKILAVDPTMRSVVGETRLDRYCQAVSDGVVSCVDETDESIKIFELTLTR